MVSNIWATTLAGTVADTISTSALAEMDDLQILKGGWNESTNPKWYLLKNDQYKHLTEVSLRGSLDGEFEYFRSTPKLYNRPTNIYCSRFVLGSERERTQQQIFKFQALSAPSDLLRVLLG